MLKVSAFLVAALVSAPLFAATATGTKPGTYLIDPAHSKIGFEIPHLVISTVEGKFTKVDGNVTLAEPFAKSTVTATVDISSIDTGNPKRDDHLRSPEFFDVGKFLKMSFAGHSVTGTPQAFKLHGDLTIKGITKPVTFDGKYLGMVNDGMGNDRVAFTATTVIKRGDFGLKWNKMVEAGPVVGENVTIQLRIEATKPAAPAPAASMAKAPAAPAASAPAKKK
jgi:polyisoprenoid-binding protein YceI